MLKILTCGLLLFCLSANGQYFSVSDFHSDFERKTFEQISEEKVIEPSIFLVTADQENSFEDYRDLSLFIKTLSSKFKDPKYSNLEMEKKLKLVFKHTQKKYFKSYKLYNSYSDLIEKGNFNCISGTAFYALLFHELGFKTHIYETPFHAYLEVEKEDGSVLLIESTDAAFGVVNKSKKIETRRDEYARGESQYIARGLGNKNNSPDEIFTNEISLLQLAGLQYYNEAVLAFNSGEFENASRLLKKAAYLYPSSRIIMLQLLSDKFIASNY